MVKGTKVPLTVTPPLKMKMDKKAQLKIQQMVFMLLAITLFFILVGLFVLGIKLSGLRDLTETEQERNALLLVTKLANSPEFSCGEAFGTGKVSCVDADKVMILRENIKQYHDFWDVENIEIRKIYPESEEDKECDFESYPDCNIIKIREGEISAEQTNFVILCRKMNNEGFLSNKCELAKMMVSY